VQGGTPQQVLAHVVALLAYGGVGFYIALVLTRRRLLK
jgi:lipooligosaccharide transport system permease protein